MGDGGRVRWVSGSPGKPRRLTPEPISSSPGTARSPPSISSLTSCRDLDAAAATWCVTTMCERMAAKTYRQKIASSYQLVFAGHFEPGKLLAFPPQSCACLVVFSRFIRCPFVTVVEIFSADAVDVW